jgi:lipopolysaccharide biosynthesis regulator YciM
MNSSTLSDAEKEVLVRLKDHVREVVDRAAYNVGSVLDSDRSAAWVNEAQQATSAAVAEAVRAMVQEPMTEFANAMANVEGILSRGGALRASTMDNLKRAYQKLQGFSFMAPDDLQRRLTAVGSVIESLDFKEVNSSESASRALANHFAEVREQVTSEETHVAVYGRFRRSISL